MGDKKFLKRFFLGIGATVLNQSINLVYQFASIAIFIHYWGESYYGEWLLIYSFSQYLTMGDVGISTTLSNKVASLMDTKNYIDANKWFSNGWFILTIFSISVFFFILFIIIFLQKDQYKLITEPDLIKCLCFTLLYVFVFIQTNLLSGIYTASLNFAKQKNIDSIAKILEFSSVLICLFFSGKVVLISFSMFFCRSIVLLYIIYDVQKTFHWFSFKINLIEQRTMKEIIRPAIANMFLNLGYLMYYNGPTILVGYYLGNIVVPQYYALMTIIRAAKQLPLLINLPLYPEYSRLIGLNKLKSARTLHKTAILATFVVSFLTITFVLLFSNLLLNILFKNKEINIISPFFEICLLALLLQCIWHGSTVVLVGSNKHIKLASHFFLSSILGYIIIIILIPSIQLTAVALGLLTIDCLMLFSTSFQVFHLLDENIKGFFDISIKTISTHLKSFKNEE
ncbi:lipopolysaccharide biosynthesis protein [Runella sp.]|uniref:lipopolysaccharide biosynthesis protein n=1 Tax=Runella sp. TaxID=1960881 RepID=UPI00301B05B3